MLQLYLFVVTVVYVLEYSKVSRLDQIVDKIIITSIFKCSGVIRVSCVLLEPDTYPFTTRLPALATTAHKTTPYQCRQERLIPKTKALLGKVPQALIPVRALLGSFPREEKGLSCLNAASCYLGSATELPTSTAYTRSQRNRSSSLCLDSFLCRLQEVQRMLFYAFHCLLHCSNTPKASTPLTSLEHQDPL